MDTPYRVVRLQRNRLYPTYQLFAHMASKKTTPQDGLRLAALTTMEWLRLRLGTQCPKNCCCLARKNSVVVLRKRCSPFT